MLLVPLCAFDNLPVYLPGNIADMWKPDLVRHAIAVHILVRVGAESDHIFLTKNLQDRVYLIHLKSHALIIQSDAPLSHLVIKAVDTEIEVETVWF